VCPTRAEPRLPVGETAPEAGLTSWTDDSPLEGKRFGNAELGKGFVVRAEDNSNIIPLRYVERVVKLARETKLPMQYGVTGGGNDGLYLRDLAA